MKAVVLQKFGGPEVLQITELPSPKPSPGQITVSLRASGLNPVDWKIREGLLVGRLPHHFPIVPGWDGAGIVTAIENSSCGFQLGDSVYTYARSSVVQWGTYAESINLNFNQVAPKPKNLNFIEAAAVPLSALTAYQALFESLRIQYGQTLLIHGGAGGVGAFAIQLAKLFGVKIFTTASAKNHTHVKNLGAHWVIDYQNEDFVKVILKKFPRGIDAVFDTVGGETQKKSISVLKAGGRLSSILALDPSVSHHKSIQPGYVFVRPDRLQLDFITKLFEQDKLQIRVAKTFPLSQAAEAQELLRSQKAGGKIVLTLEN